MIPSQKLGTETPQSDTPLASTSHGVLRRTAAITPAGMAMATATSSDRQASSSVIGSLMATVPATDCAGADRFAEVAAHGEAEPAEVLQRRAAR